MSSWTGILAKTSATPELRAARERLLAAGRRGDPLQIERAACTLLWLHHRAMLQALVRAGAGALRDWAGRPVTPPRRWRGGRL